MGNRELVIDAQLPIPRFPIGRFPDCPLPMRIVDFDLPIAHLDCRLPDVFAIADCPLPDCRMVCAL
jgi:hypothetical protein